MRRFLRNNYAPAAVTSRTVAARESGAGAPIRNRGTRVKDPITADLGVAGFKAAPAIIGAAASSASSWQLADVAVLLTILYTASLLFTTVINNWGRWSEWWKARWAAAKRLWAWLRR